ncbi:hypothetical protein LR48_Vigan07g205000 [Vigna angularis]|uniref:Uncharacterized protein n=1 Tax=Phaseolus angularis TaxID=3914 RepID=A0A0L9V064_PHAAN|nr:hypothetical protein LR48_Vigan07g205000 [Vigna angularis]
MSSGGVPAKGAPMLKLSPIVCEVRPTRLRTGWLHGRLACVVRPFAGRSSRPSDKADDEYRHCIRLMWYALSLDVHQDRSTRQMTGIVTTVRLLWYALSLDVRQDVRQDIMSIPAPCKSSLMSLRKELGGAPSSSKAPSPVPHIKEGGAGRPLLGGLFIPEFNASHKINFHMSSLHRLVVESLFEAQVTNAILELSTRASMLSWYLRGQADRHGSEQVLEDLVAEKEISTDLRAEVEALKVVQEEREGRLTDLQLELDEACRQLNQATELLRDAPNRRKGGVEGVDNRADRAGKGIYCGDQGLTKQA